MVCFEGSPIISKCDELKNEVINAGRNLLGEIYPVPFPILKSTCGFY